MVKKEIIDKNRKEIKKLLKSKDLVIGTERTLKYLRAGNVKKVFVVINCDDDVKNELKHYSAFNNAEFVELQYPNEDLGEFCKKPFSISVISILKHSIPPI